MCRDTMTALGLAIILLLDLIACNAQMQRISIPEIVVPVRQTRSVDPLLPHTALPLSTLKQPPIFLAVDSKHHFCFPDGLAVPERHCTKVTSRYRGHGESSLQLFQAQIEHTHPYPLLQAI